jgi:ATP-binding cassette subfamily B protein
MVAGRRWPAYIQRTLSDASTSSGLRASLSAADERKASKSLQPLRELAPFVLRYPVRLALTLGFLFIAALATLAIPIIAGRIIDVGFIERNLDALGNYSLIAIGIALVMAIAFIAAVLPASRAARQSPIDSLRYE